MISMVVGYHTSMFTLRISSTVLLHPSTREGMLPSVHGCEHTAQHHLVARVMMAVCSGDELTPGTECPLITCMVERFTVGSSPTMHVPGCETIHGHPLHEVTRIVIHIQVRPSVLFHEHTGAQHSGIPA